MNFKEGEVLYFNKPLGWTSFKVVGHARYHICRRMGLKKLKVGHAGTLDPLATGVMIVCTGRATKRIEEFQLNMSFPLIEKEKSQSIIFTIEAIEKSLVANKYLHRLYYTQKSYLLKQMFI